MEENVRLNAWVRAFKMKVKDVWSQYHGGLLEGVYQDAISIELESMGIDAPTEVDIPMYHKGVKMKHQYRADMVMCDEVIVEFKACKELVKEHRAQLFNYMRLTKKKVGILANFSQSEYRIEVWKLDLETNKCDFL